MLLEEAILHLLRGAGYRTVERSGGDPTLDTCSAGLQVRGRGSKHQIDAIADFLLPPPFGNPVRLLVEGKCYAKPVGIAFVRNGVGVLKDVNEFWQPMHHAGIPKKRYHYQYAIFSTSRFTADAERYAFAHDVCLVPLGESRFLQPLVQSLEVLGAQDFGSDDPRNVGIRLSDLRRKVRASLRGHGDMGRVENGGEARVPEAIQEFLEACRTVRYALVAMIAGTFPVFLVPDLGVRLEQLEPEMEIHLYRDHEGTAWIVTTPDAERTLFSFDLPPQLFALYESEGMLQPRQAHMIKAEFFSDFYAVCVLGERLRVVRFRLERRFLDRLRAEVDEKRRVQPRGEQAGGDEG